MVGIEPSPGFVRQPEGSGCVGRFIRTFKENLLLVRRFATIEELRLALLEFQRLDDQSPIAQHAGDRTPPRVRGELGILAGAV